MKKIILISGHPGAGKTTSANYLKSLLNAKIVNVGDIIRDYFLSNKIVINNREELGTFYLENYSADLLYKLIIENLNHEINIIDGLRLFSVSEKLISEHQLSTFFFIDSNEAIRKERLYQRFMNYDDKEVEKRIKKYNEFFKEIELIKNISGVVIINNDSLENLFVQLENGIKNSASNNVYK